MGKWDAKPGNAKLGRETVMRIAPYLCCLLVFATSLMSRAETLWMVPPVEPSTNQWFAWRTTFEVTDVPETAIAEIACDSKYWLWINGEPAVREGQLKRGPTPDATYMDRIDLSAFLTRGTNTVALLQWFYGKHGFSHNNSGSPGLYFNLTTEDLRIPGGGTWKVARHPAFESMTPAPNYRLPEASVLFDARKEMSGWAQPGFDDSGWNVPKPAGPRGGAPWGVLEPRPIPQWKNWGVREFKRITWSEMDGVRSYRAELPYDCHVHPVLELKGPAGQHIEFKSDTTGRLGKNAVRGAYVTREGHQVYEHLPWLSGHELFFRIPQCVEVVSLRFRETGYDAEWIGAWKSDDPVLDELWQRARRTLYVNMRDTYMDCPDRERAQWWGDVVVQLGQNVYLFDYDTGQDLLRKGILELARWQREDGSIYSPVPSGRLPDGLAPQKTRDGSYGRELPYQMLSSIGWYGFWRYALFSGDRETIERVYPSVKKYLSLWKIDPRGVTAPRHPEGAWIWVDWGRFKDEPVLASCWHYLALKGAVEMARLVGADEDITDYERTMATIKAHFHDVYWKGGHYRSEKLEWSATVKELDDRANAMAVVAGLAPESVYPELRAVLKEQMHASPYMEKYVLEALFLMGYPEDALARMKSRYQVMLDLPITTLREHFHYSNGTDNHAWSGGPLTMMEEFIAGIYPTSPAYATYRIRPMMGTVQSLETKVATARGPLELALSRGKSFTLELKPPPGSVGEIHVPNKGGRSIGKIVVNGKVVWKKGKGVDHPDAAWVEHRDGYEVLQGIRTATDIEAR
jgi:alpha-L-rhamnosidase